MNQQPEKDFNSATAVNNEDIKGLLKAAGLNEFYADVKSQDSNLKFEKSGSLLLHSFSSRQKQVTPPKQ